MGLIALAFVLPPALASAERPRKSDVQRERSSSNDSRSQRKTSKRKSREELEEERWRRSDPFAKGRTRLSVNGGMAFDLSRNQVFALGVGFGYFVYHGVELGFDSGVWLGSDPFVAQFSPQVRYVLDIRSPVRPYVGGFHRHWFISGLSDVDALGVRFGIFYAASPRSFMGVGAAYEAIVSDCEDFCTEWYPELVFSLSF